MSVGKITDKVKGTVTGAKDKVVGVGEGAKDTVTGRDASHTSGGTGAYEEGAPGTETGRKDDPLTSYREKEPMTPAKIKEHEPTAVKREMTEKITEPGQTGVNPEEAAEMARKKGMAKGTAGAAETGSEYEQGAAGTSSIQQKDTSRSSTAQDKDSSYRISSIQGEDKAVVSTVTTVPTPEGEVESETDLEVPLENSEEDIESGTEPPKVNKKKQLQQKS
jgi:hypothetical protein